MRALVESLAPAIDGRIDLDHVLSVDDWVVARFTVRGNHVGAVMGIEPTDESVTVQGIEMTRFEDGQLVEGWQVFDALGLLQQIGAIPAEFGVDAPGTSV